MSNEPIIIHAIINGEKVETEKKFPRENPAHPDEIVGYAPVNTKEKLLEQSILPIPPSKIGEKVK